MKVRFSRLASAELEEAYAWYDGREPGLGAAFLAEVTATVDLIVERPGMFAVVFGATRRALLRRFPYFLLFEVFPDCAVVFGVIHGARDPKKWMSRRGP